MYGKIAKALDKLEDALKSEGFPEEAAEGIVDEIEEQIYEGDSDDEAAEENPQSGTIKFLKPGDVVKVVDNDQEAEDEESNDEDEDEEA